MRGRQIAMSMVGTAIFFLLALLLGFATFDLYTKEDPATKWLLLVSGIFFVLFICNLIFGLNACNSKFCSVMLLIMAIIGMPWGGFLGIFNLFSYIYSRKYLKGEYVMNMAERAGRRMQSRRERRREERERRRNDPDYKRFINTLKGRKAFAFFKSLFMLALTSLHSIAGFLLILETTKDERFVLLMIVGYLVLCPISLFLKGVDPFFSYDYSKTTITATTRYTGDSWSGDAQYRTDYSSDTNYYTGRFITIPGLLYYLVGWAVCFTQAIGVLISLFTRYNSRHVVCGRSIRKIPREFLSLGIAGSFITYFLFSFVFVSGDYLNYLEDQFCQP